MDRNDFWVQWTAPNGVALLAEGVDRNKKLKKKYPEKYEVALLAEGVDRNPWRRVSGRNGRWVALLAEGVDRNYC